MKLLADESVESAVEGALREEGHDLVSVAETSPGATDRRVLARAKREGRVLLTNDKDFAELAFLQRTASAGILLIRLPHFRAATKARRVAEVVRQQGRALVGAVTVVDAHAIRRRPLPRRTRATRR
jgi:predicted nuclease of predicted toxin-antitoxin system